MELKKINNSELNIDNKIRSNLLPWRGQFSPQLVESFINEYAESEYKVFDPFVGSGTVLYESGRFNLVASGCDINPAAFKLSSFYKFINISIVDRQKAFLNVEKGINSITDNGKLISFVKEETKNNYILALVKLWKTYKNINEKIIIETIIILLDFYNTNLDKNKILQTTSKVRNLLLNLPVSQKIISAFLNDSRYTDEENNYYDLVITSPPYINVFNYHQKYRRSIESINCHPLMSAQAEIGANRKFRANRFFTVIQYCLDMALVLKELNRICKPNAHIIFVIGRVSSVRKTSFKNSEIFKQLIENIVCFSYIMEQERYFTNKFGQKIYEDIIHIKNDDTEAHIDFNAIREIGRKVLEDAKNRVPKESENDLLQAIGNYTKIMPSPKIDLKKIIRSY